MILPLAYHKGEIVSTDTISFSANNLSLHRGYGIFDYFTYHNGQNIHLEWYLDRFYSSASKANLKLDLGRSELIDTINQIYKSNNIQRSNIKLILSGGNSLNGFTYNGDSELMILNYQHQDNPTNYYSDGVRLITYEHVRPFAEIKTTNYMIPYLMQPELTKVGAIDVLYVSNSMVSETSRANIFSIKKGQITTPDQHVLPGITRKALLTKCNEFPIIAKPLTLAEILSADEVFISSSTKKAMPVIQINDQVIGTGKVGPITTKLNHWLTELYA